MTILEGPQQQTLGVNDASDVEPLITTSGLSLALKRELKLSLRADGTLCRRVEDYQFEKCKINPDTERLDKLAVYVLFRLRHTQDKDSLMWRLFSEQLCEESASPVVEFLSNYHAPQMKPSPSETYYDKEPRPDQDKALRRDFFESTFRGSWHIVLAKALIIFEEKCVESWQEYRRQSTPQTRPWFGRCLPIVQSSGMGKSRLMRELGQVTNVDGRPVRFTVFMLCLRWERGPTINFPWADTEVRRYLNETERASNWRYLWKLKLHAWFEAFWINAKHWVHEDAEEWERVCDSRDFESEAARSDFLCQVRKLGEPIYKERKQEHPHETDLSSLQSVLRVQAACQNFMTTCYPDSWFVLAIDSASGLQAGMDPDLKPSALHAIRTLFSTPLGTVDGWRKQMSPEKLGPDPPKRCWLLLADGNVCINKPAPTTEMSDSEWSRHRLLERCPPLCPVTLNIHLEEPEVARQLLFELSPIQSCSWPILALGGRPMWASLSSDAIEGREGSNLLHRTTFVSLELVLAKILSPSKLPAEIAEIWEALTIPQYMALVFQRLELWLPSAQELEGDGACFWPDDQATWVHRHLLALRGMPCRGEEYVLQVVHEPLVVQAAAGFMRQGGAPYLARPLADTGMWEAALRALKETDRMGVPWDSEIRGNIDAQALFCMCHDKAGRRPSPGLDLPGLDRAKQEDPYSGYSAYVHLQDYLRQLTNWEQPELDRIVAEYGANAWVTAQCFRRTSDRPITRQDLVQAFHERYGIVGAKNQATWDLVIPLYCGDLNNPYSAGAWSFIVVQVKARRDTNFIQHDPPVFPIGDLSWPEDATVSPKGNMVPIKPPIFVWVNMLSSGKDTPIEVVECTTRASTLKSSSEAAQQPRFWQIKFLEFDSNNHPALAGLDQKVFPTLTHREDEGPILENYVPEYKMLADAAIDGSHRFQFNK